MLAVCQLQPKYELFGLPFLVLMTIIVTLDYDIDEILKWAIFMGI